MGGLRKKLKSVAHRLRYGLVMEAVKQRLASIGVLIEPYYWIQEGVNEITPSELQGDYQEYTLRFFDPEELKAMAADKESACTEDELLSRVRAGQKCFGATSKGEIVAYMWIDLDRCSWKNHEFDLGPDEAYLFNMHTASAFRGKGLAPYVRWQSYQHLKQMGRDKLYSYSDYFNTPAIRFKQKLKARFLGLGIHIELFKKYHWNWGFQVCKQQTCPAVKVTS